MSSLDCSSLNAKAEALARLIAGEEASVRRLDWARRVAEAEIDILRVRNARSFLLRHAIENVAYEPPKARKFRIKVLLAALSTDVTPRAGSFLAQQLTGPGVDARAFAARWLLPQRLSEMDRIAAVMRELTGKLATLDRYERRAMSRRKFAIRNFDRER